MTLVEMLLVACPILGLCIGLDFGLRHGTVDCLIGGFVGLIAGLLLYPVALFIAFIPCMAASIMHSFHGVIFGKRESTSENAVSTENDQVWPPAPRTPH